MTRRAVAVDEAGGVSGAYALGGYRMLPYDVRLQRELTHRRLVVSMMRRLTRVVSLHLLDGALLVAVLSILDRWFFAPGLLRPHLAILVTIFLLCLNAVSAYQPGDARRDRGKLFSGIVLGLFILACLGNFPAHLPLGGGFLLALGGGAFAALAVGREGVDQLVRQAYVHGIGLRRAVLVGDLAEVGRAIRELRDDRNIDQYMVGHLAVGSDPDPTALGVLRDLPRVLDEHNVQEVVIATSLPPEALSEVAERCFARGTSLYVLPSVIGTAGLRSEPRRVGACTVLHLHPARLEVPSLFLKRIFDLVVASLLLVLVSPIVLFLALLIRFDSPGPIFFRQRRIGLGGRPFTMWKFRSMSVSAEDEKAELARMNAYSDGRLFKLRADPRITRVGRFLRRSSLDELPQLFNVILGDMSLVGPRPPLPCEVAAYEPHHFDRLRVVPGITGPWQVGGRNLITDFDRIVRMEREYIRSWSLGLDAKILFRTIEVVIRGEGAY